MSLLVPKEFLEQVNVFSGYLAVNATQGERELKGLFRDPANEKYVSKYILRLLVTPQFIADNTNSLKNGQRDGPEMYNNKITPRAVQLAKLFSENGGELVAVIPQLMAQHHMPYNEDIVNNNPIQQLHYVNKKFMLETARTVAQSPEIVIPNYEFFNHETGKIEMKEYDYGPSSYADGVWRPEELFTQSTRNRENPYWVLERVEFSDAPEAVGAGNKWKDFAGRQDPRDLYDGETGEAYVNEDRLATYEPTDYTDLTVDDLVYLDYMAEHGKNLNAQQRGQRESMTKEKGERISASRQSVFSKGAQVPFWQYTVNDRPYDRTAEGLKDGGRNDRRVQRPAGYDMSKLANRSSKQRRTVPLKQSPN